MKKVAFIPIAFAFLLCNTVRAGITPDFEQGVLGYQILSEEEHTVAVCGANDSEITSIDVPETIVNDSIEYKVVAIANEAFMRSKLTEIHLPQTLKAVGAYAFCDCPLSEIIFPDSIMKIGECAFFNCSLLKKARIPDRHVIVETAAFSGTRLDSIIIRNSIEYGFAVYSLTKETKGITIEPGVKEIPGGMFMGRFDQGIAPIYSGCSSVVFPETITKIGSCAFETNRLTSLVIHESCVEIDSAAFGRCPVLERIKLPNTLERLGTMAFYLNSSLKEVEVPASVNTLKTGVFAGCKDLERIVIHSENVEHFFSFPDTLLNGFGGSSWLAIAKNNEPWMNTIVFGKEVKRISLGNDKEKSNGKPYGRAHIQNVYCEGIIPPEGGIWQAGATLHVPKGCREVYASAKIWALYGDYIVDDIELSGIHNAQLKTQDSDAPTYDLQGRRVENPKQGEIYIQKGKKYINK